MAMTPEGKVKKEIDKILVSYGERLVWFKPATGGYGRSGISDYAGCVDGNFFSIEAKSPVGKPTALQIKFMASVEAAGGTALVCDGTNYAELRVRLNRLMEKSM